MCQKAPSAKRCIKTRPPGDRRRVGWHVRKHRAPKGALRPPAADASPLAWRSVRKHRAPKGALRLQGGIDELPGGDVRKHRAPKGALRRGDDVHFVSNQVRGSESTERQKVH